MNDREELSYRGSGDPAPALLPGGWEQPERYIVPDDLREAVNVALYLRRPLLLEGDPGCGKTRLAYAVAYELGYPLKEIYVRSTSRAQDLLYTFDAVRRLYDIQERNTGGARGPGPDKEQYVKLGRLGEAIALAQNDIPSVVLIDEIDKADIDFPNDLLLVLDRLQFEVDELPEDAPNKKYDALKGQTRESRRTALPLVIITSNREKEMPAPFLRRCLFYYIGFPKAPVLQDIVATHFPRGITPLFTVALKRFWELRDHSRITWRKKPGTSELLDWIAVLERDEQANVLNATQLESALLGELPHLEALVKNQSDRGALPKETSNG